MRNDVVHDSRRPPGSSPGAGKPPHRAGQAADLRGL